MSSLPTVTTRSVASCPDALRPFVEAGVLTPTDVHVAQTLCRLLPCGDPDALLGIAMAARAPRVGHTCLSVDHAAELVGFEVPGRDPEETESALAGLSWPSPDAWLSALGASPVCGPPDAGLPLVVDGRLVFLRRQYEQEAALWEDLRRRAAVETAVADEGRLDALLGQLFADSDADDPQVIACRSAVRRRLSVLTGGPGTGKTWTVARILAVLIDQAQAEGREVAIALAAPTAKAAAQLSGSLQAEVAALPVADGVREAITAVGRGQTIHGLLGRKTATRFWHDRARPLRHDIVVVDEVSMGSLALMTRLLEAVRPDARVVLIGDPDQLPSVEAGSVLADVVDRLDAAVVTRLTKPRRFGADSGIAALAAAIRDGDADQAVHELRTRPDLDWIEAAEPTEAQLEPIRERFVDRAQRMHEAAVAGDVTTARACLTELVLLTPHRRGRWGVAGWNARIDRWYAEGVHGWHPYAEWQPGRTVLVTRNDRTLDVYNGDLGVVVATPHGPRVAFHADTDRLIAPPRLPPHELVHTMTIHKSQGSQWGRVVLALPPVVSRALTRQLLYTAATRAASRLDVVGTVGPLSSAITTHRSRTTSHEGSA